MTTMIRTHRLSPALNEAISNFRNAAWRQRDLNAARAALEDSIESALEAKLAEGQAALRVEIERFPGHSELLAWLVESAESADDMARDERTRRTGCGVAPDAIDEEPDVAFWLNEARMLRAAFRLLTARAQDGMT